MLADRARMTSGGGFPQGAVFLSHMESLPAADIAGGKQFVTIAGSPSITSFKFGNAVRLQSFQQIAVQQPVILQSTPSSDWTIEFHFKLITTLMNNGRPLLLGVYDQANNFFGVELERDIEFGQYRIVASLGSAGKFYPYGEIYLYITANGERFFRMYKKGSEHGLIIDGTKYVLDATPTYNYLVGSHPTQSILSGNSNEGDFAIEEVLLCKDFGNDSLIIPTAPY